MIRPAFALAGTAVQSNTVAITPAWPAHSIGQVALLIVENRDATFSLSDAQGFVLQDTIGTGTGGLAASVGIAVYWCRATSAAMAAPTVAFPGGHHLAQIITFNDCQESGTPFGIGAKDVLASASTTVTAPGFTATGDLSLAVLAVAHRLDVAVPQFDTWVNATLANLLEQVDSASSIGNGGGFAITTGDVAADKVVAATTAVLLAASQQARLSLELLGRRCPKFISAGARSSAGGPHNGEEGTGPTWGAGHQAGDVAILLCEHNNDGPLLFDDAKGFVAVPNGRIGAGTDYLKDSQLSAFWCRATNGAMEQPVVTFPDPTPGAGMDHWVTKILVFRGIPSDVVFDQVFGSVQGDDAASPSATGTVVGAPTAANDCLVLLVAGNGFDTAVHNAAWTPPAELLDGSEIEPNASTSFGKGGGFSVWAGRKPTSGSIGNATVVWNVLSEVLPHLLIALRGSSDVLGSGAGGSLSLQRRMRAAGRRRRERRLP